MSYTLTTATTQVRNLLNESTAAFWTDAEIQEWIKQGVIDISSKLLCVVAYDEITIVTNQYEYTSSDESWIAACLKPKHVFYDDTTNTIPHIGMQKLELDQFGHNAVGDQPTKYYFYESALRRFYIWPYPTVAVNADVIGVIYAYETDDVTLLKDEYQPLVFLYACYKAKLKERLYQEAMVYFQLYKDSVLFERQDKYDLGNMTSNELLVK